MQKIIVSALEPSANLHLKKILEHLPKDIELAGVFDRALGEALYDSHEFGVMGFVDIIPLIFKAKMAIKEIAFLSKDADSVLLIDSPAFNIPLAKAIKKLNPNIKITYYILPQVWAWKAHRVQKVEQLCDNLLAILPFEPKFWNKARYVGNPVVSNIEHFNERLVSNNTIAFLAGSRKSEIKKLMSYFNALAIKLSDKKIYLVIPPFFKQEEIAQIYGENLERYELIFDTHKALREASYAFVCSGTASLEASLIGTPFTLVYRAKKIDYFIAKRFVKLPYIGLANLIFHFLGKEALHEELIQDDVSVEAMLQSYERCDKEAFLAKSKELRQILHQEGAKEVARVVLN